MHCGWGRYHDTATDSCLDLDECSSSNLSDFCAPENLSSCTNQNPGYTCVCEAGYEPVVDDTHTNYNPDFPERGPFKCVDIDECLLETDNCTSLQTCVNLSGSFRCADEGIDVLDNMNSEDLLIESLIQDGMDQTAAETLVSSIFSHGCVCSQIATGGSDYHPEGELDQICQKYLKCKKCWSNYFGDCDVTFFTIDHYLVPNTFSCDGGETCENKTCECSLNFAAEVTAYMSNNAGFVADENANCTLRQGNGGSLNCDEFTV